MLCKKEPRSLEGKDKHPGDVLFSPRVAPPVSSALRRFTSVFGMGTGGSISLKSPRYYLENVSKRTRLGQALATSHTLRRFSARDAAEDGSPDHRRRAWVVMIEDFTHRLACRIEPSDRPVRDVDYARGRVDL